jgi:phosphomannomutase
VLRDVLGDMLEAAGATIVRLGRSSTFIPVDTEAVSEEVQAQICAWTGEHRLDALASADGDGDRPLLADETGICLRGDLLGLLTALLLNADAVVTPITSNSGIEAQLSAHVRRTRVGSPFVIEAMGTAAKAGSERIIGFEANGGVMTASPFQVAAANLAPLPTRDSMLPILASLAAARSVGVSLSRLAASLDLPVAASGLIRALPTQTSQALIAKLTNNATERAAFCEPFCDVASLDLTDGLCMRFHDGTILHLRPSGNAPEMRVYVEAADAVRCTELMRGGIERVIAWTSAV